jgi:hypothetical protein
MIASNGARRPVPMRPDTSPGSSRRDVDANRLRFGVSAKLFRHGLAAGGFALLLSWLYPFPLRPEPLSRAVFPDRPDWAQCWKVFWHGLQPSLPQRLKRRFRVDVYSSLAKSISVHSPLSHTCGYLTGTAAKWFTPQNEDRSDTLAQFMVSLWPEERSFEADRKVSKSLQFEVHLQPRQKAIFHLSISCNSRAVHDSIGRLLADVQIE